MNTATIDARATGTRIWSLREENGLTVEELSELLGLAGPRALYKWRNGESLPTLKNLIVLSEIFKTPIDSMVVRDAA